MEAVTIGTPDHPNLALWNKLYAEKKDVWSNEIGGQKLLKYYDILTEGKTELNVLFPMCGRTQVMLRFAERGHHVVGIEWSEEAVEKFFEQNHLSHSKEPVVIDGKSVTVYKANEKTIVIYCGDFFAFQEGGNKAIGQFDCVFDHGAIGCFDFTKVKRSTYAEIIDSLTKLGGRVLLSTFDYEHAEHPTIPFSVTEEEIKGLYEDKFETPKLLVEYNAEQTAEIFKLRYPESLFPVWTLSRFSWKILLLVKQSS